MNTASINTQSDSKSSFVSVHELLLSRVLNGVFHRLNELEYQHALLEKEVITLRKRKDFMFETSE